MPTTPEDRRPPLAIAMEWVSRITTVSLVMVLPALAGLWCDSKWGTGPWLVTTGAVFGMAAGMMQLLRMTGAVKKSKPDDGDENRPAGSK